jgi:hypothetical protein
MGSSRVGGTSRDFQAAGCQLEEAISKQQLDWRKEERGKRRNPQRIRRRKVQN